MAGILEGKVALVTGSGQSIGAAIAIGLAEHGAAVVTNSRSATSPDGTPTALDTVAEISAAGGDAVAVFADIGTMDGARAAVETAVRAFGGLDILVNNAGFGLTVAVEEMTEGQWGSVLAANLTGTFATVHHAVPHMRRRGSGRILNVISRVGLAGSATMSAYAAAKSGVVGFSYAVAKELVADRITVNCLAPTANTVRAQRTAEERHRMTGRVIPASANRTPAHIAPLACWLVGPEAAGITGQVFYAAAGEVTHYSPPEPRRTLLKQGMWTVDELSRTLPGVIGTELVPPVSPLPPQ